MQQIGRRAILFGSLAATVGLAAGLVCAQSSASSDAFLDALRADGAGGVPRPSRRLRIAEGWTSLKGA